jgi:hypothetical protein
MSVLGMTWPARRPRLPRPERIKRKADGQVHLPVGRLILLVLLACLVVEGFLGVRLWAQLTSQPIDEGSLPFVFDTTDYFISPFAEFEPSAPIRETGILEISTLIAMQAYLIAAAAIVLVIMVLGGLIRLWFRPQREVPITEEGTTDATLDPTASLNEALRSP